MDEETDGGRFRRLPPPVRPTGTEHDVTPPPATAEVKYVSGLSPAGGVAAYEEVADYLTSAPRTSRRRIVALVILGVGLAALVLSQLI